MNMANSPTGSVLVVEYGDIEYAAGQYDPPKLVWGETGGSASRWELTSTPSPALNNATAFVMAGRVVGGSSAVNGMVFDRGSRYDYDAWQQLQGENTKSSPRWDWEGIYPFFKKSVTFTAPSPEITKKYNYTWELSAFGNSTPIYATLPPFQWGDHFAVRNSWQNVGIELNNECANGNKEGLCWVPISEHPITARRSHAGLGHYADIIANRPNYHLLVRYQVTRLIYPGGDPKAGPPTVEIRDVDTGKLTNVTAKAEVVLSAGVFGSTAVLQRSGIGPAALLKSLGIPVVLDLPGVGANLQDHSGPGIEWKCKHPCLLLPTSCQLNCTGLGESKFLLMHTPTLSSISLELNQNTQLTTQTPPHPTLPTQCHPTCLTLPSPPLPSPDSTQPPPQGPTPSPCPTASSGSPSPT